MLTRILTNPTSSEVNNLMQTSSDPEIYKLELVIFMEQT